MYNTITKYKLICKVTLKAHYPLFGYVKYPSGHLMGVPFRGFITEEFYIEKFSHKYRDNTSPIDTGRIPYDPL